MKIKVIGAYFIWYVGTSAILAVVALLILPIFAACDCLVNDVKAFLIFPGSFITAIGVLLLAYRRRASGLSFKQAFRPLIIYAAIIYGVVSIANLVING